NFSYSDSDLGPLNESTLQVWKYNASGWTNATFWSVNGVDTANNVVYANITNFASTFAPLGPYNTAPSQVILYSPSSGSTTTNRTPTFTWNNATDAEGDTLVYWLQVDDDPNFGSPAINVTGIAEGSPRTSYTAPSELAVDTTYFWRARAYDGKLYGDWSDTWNLTILSSTEISLTNDLVDFGTVSLSQTYDTSADSPLPFIVQNDGNVLVNVTIYGTDFWQRFANPSPYYQFKCRANTSACPSGSQTSWANMPNASSPSTLVVNMNYTDGADRVKSDIKIVVPSDEPAGGKSSTVYVIAVAA
ncbi:MAG: hypothetical protein QXL81_03080, partial [Candidatus Aenigmatarchaeota archaeon]